MLLNCLNIINIRIQILKIIKLIEIKSILKTSRVYDDWSIGSEGYIIDIQVIFLKILFI